MDMVHCSDLQGTAPRDPEVASSVYGRSPGRWCIALTCGGLPRDPEVALEVMGVAWDAVQCSDLRGTAPGISR